ncbi:hypothetical protein ZOSMA_2G02570 [Zostera marina]|uniref:Uncharacterized protein n=1 Tax=Zostera marina TaxID=29655 RepID=A0A0K9PDD9_ZOSMR|nr:hypothetical protein ZOSMA_2G02570 [Zostera marina]
MAARSRRTCTALLLLLSFLVSSIDAVPSSTWIKERIQEKSLSNFLPRSNQENRHASAVQNRINGGGDGFQNEEESLKRSMQVLEISDYPGTSANKRHIPKPEN